MIFPAVREHPALFLGPTFMVTLTAYNMHKKGQQLTGGQAFVGGLVGLAMGAAWEFVGSQKD